MLKSILLSSLFLSFIALISARSLHVGLHAAWSHTALSAEAVSWIAHIRGHHHVLPFLKTYIQHYNQQSNHLSSIDKENTALFQSISKHFATTSSVSTLKWVLHARQYSPLVYLHYSTAHEYLNIFGSQLIPTDSFAITFNADTIAKLHTSHQQLSNCEQCHKVDISSENLSLLIRPFPDEIQLNSQCIKTSPKTTMIFYAHLPSSSLHSWLDSLQSVMSTCEYNVVLRFWNPKSHSENDSSSTLPNPSLQGFFVRSSLKSTEYKVVDDRVFNTRLFPDCGYGDVKCSSHSQDQQFVSKWPSNDDEYEKTTFSGMKVLSYLQDKANNSFDKALSELHTFVEDLPAVTRSKEFNEFEIDEDDDIEDLDKAVREFRNRIGQRDYLFINDILFEPQLLKSGTEKFFNCLSKISSFTESIHTLRKEEGLSENNFAKESEIKTARYGLRVDLDLDKLLPTSLVWFNDLFKDKRYKNWNRLDSQEHIQEFLTKIEKHTEQSKERNLDHLRLVKTKEHHLTLTMLLDPGDIQQFGYVNAPASLIKADLPLRVGMVLIPNGRISSLVAAGFHYLLRAKGRKTALSFTGMIVQVMQYFGGGFQRVPINEEIVELAFRETASQAGVPVTTADSILENDEEIQGILNEARRYAERLNLFTELKAEDYSIDKREGNFLAMTSILNGIVLKDLQNDLIPMAISEQDRIADMVKSNGTTMLDDEVGGFERWVKSDPNMIIVRSLSKEMRSISDIGAGPKGSESEVITSQTLFNLREDIRQLQYENPDMAKEAVVTVLLTARDLETESFQHARSIMQELAQSPFSRQTKSTYAIVNPKTDIGRAILGCATSSHCNVDEPYFAINAKLLSAKNIKSADDLTVEVASEYESSDQHILGSGILRLIHQQHLQETRDACSTDMNLYQSKSAPLTLTEITDALRNEETGSFTFSNHPTGRDWSSYPLRVTAVVDPMSESSIMIAPLLQAMQDTYHSQDLAITLSITPFSSHLQKNFDHASTFSRYVIHPPKGFLSSSITDVGVSSPRGSFYHLPQDRVLTTSVEPPRTWFVGSHATNYDMDNVILDNLPDDVDDLHSEYELRNLIVEGSCIDEGEEPPQGLKLKLQNENGLSVDTIVMSNHGYFQLKVPTPGYWSLSLAPGRSQQIFSFKAMEMFKNGARAVYKTDAYGRVPVPVGSLSGAEGIILYVERNPGMEKRSVLDPTLKVEEKKGKMFGLMESVIKTFNRKDRGSELKPKEHSTTKSTNEQDTIHVFSVASGHLYERFLKIMITSVTRHASRPVKFWLLENYLSPSFKKMIPHFARSHGAEVGMVTYRWPMWLRAQTEKQRIIWAYKILFLDVLFPLNVRRIIFVDSDQVIRGDLAELMDIDLKGAPYGYVPFCDSRKEVEGYRFWKQGFWKETLGEEKYRISALYVVDLNRFRETAAGDTLRFIYQSLSADPNSLSNLDQDLPNYASVAKSLGDPVPIFDLPQDWLWCESWCDDKSKHTAKAIDLCNNPMTKEPKLVSAKRIIGEWVEYDDAASALTEKIYEAIKTGNWEAVNQSESTKSDKRKEDRTHSRIVGEAFESKTEL